MLRTAAKVVVLFCIIKHFIMFFCFICMVGESRRVIPHVPNGKCGKPIAIEKGGIFGVRNVVNRAPTLPSRIYGVAEPRAQKSGSAISYAPTIYIKVAEMRCLAHLQTCFTVLQSSFRLRCRCLLEALSTRLTGARR